MGERLDHNPQVGQSRITFYFKHTHTVLGCIVIWSISILKTLQRKFLGPEMQPKRIFCSNCNQTLIKQVLKTRVEIFNTENVQIYTE